MDIKGFLRKTTVVGALSLPLFLSSGCGENLKQENQTVRLAPISDHKLEKRLEGVAYIFPAEAGTGYEQYVGVVSNSLARVMKEGVKNSNFLPIPNFIFNQREEKGCCKSLRVLSSSDLANKLNEKSLVEEYSEMRDFYKKNSFFRKQDVERLGTEIGADYFILPRVLLIGRKDSSRLSVLGVKLVNTRAIYTVVGMEIWNKEGHKVFDATSDTTLAAERIEEKPIAIEKALRIAYCGILKKLPK